jgi:hypothetical protein
MGILGEAMQMDNKIHIGRDDQGRIVSIHCAMTEAGECYFTSRIRESNGEVHSGGNAQNLKTFHEVQLFPAFHSIWSDLDLNFDAQIRRFRIFSTAVNHAVEMGGIYAKTV